MKNICGILIFLFALFLGVFEFLALVDPSVIQMADDSDPFGTPPGWQYHAIMITVIVVLAVFAVVLMRNGKQMVR